MLMAAASQLAAGDPAAPADNADAASLTYHQQATSRIGVSSPSTAAPPETCTLTPTVLKIGVYAAGDPAEQTSDALIMLTCSPFTHNALLLDAGEHAGGAVGLMHRQMVNADGSRYLGYRLTLRPADCHASKPVSDTPPPGADPTLKPNQMGGEWGDGHTAGTTYTEVMTTEGTGADCFRVMIEVPGQQDVLPGAYSDTVGVTLYY